MRCADLRDELLGDADFVRKLAMGTFTSDNSSLIPEFMSLKQSRSI